MNIVRNFFEEKAVDGDGQFAIAYALLELATQIKYLGNGDAATTMGAIEGLGMHIGGKIDDLTRAIYNLTPQ